MSYYHYTPNRYWNSIKKVDICEKLGIKLIHSSLWATEIIKGLNNITLECENSGDEATNSAPLTSFTMPKLITRES